MDTRRPDDEMYREGLRSYSPHWTRHLKPLELPRLTVEQQSEQKSSGDPLDE
jgi:hypothetical protein